MKEQHIVTTYDEDLDKLKSDLFEMALNVEKQIFDSVNLTQILDIKKANQIIKNDDKIDKKEKEIRQLATNTLTKRQPLADDLRKILIALKLSGTIERIADHAANIAGRMSSILRPPQVIFWLSNFSTPERLVFAIIFWKRFCTSFFFTAFVLLDERWVDLDGVIISVEKSLSSSANSSIVNPMLNTT